MKRLAIISTHPIQYYAPWFAHLSGVAELHTHVFYLFDPAKSGAFDCGFQRDVEWDVPLLEGYSHEFVPNTSAGPGTGRFFGLRNPTLKQRVLAFHPDAVLVMGYNYWSMIRFIFSWGRGRAPLIFRGDSHRIGRGRSVAELLKRALIAMVFRRFGAFLYVGQANYRYFRYHGVPERALFRSPHAVDMNRFGGDSIRTGEAALAWRRSLGIADDRIVLLFAGKFEDKKRPLDLVRAIRAIDNPAASLVMVGNGPLEDSIREEAADSVNIHFAPFQNQSDMPRTYAACDVLVLPSYGSFETWGLVVNEAMALGKPAIVSSHVGCAEDLVTARETGLVFEAGNQASLERALSIALQGKKQLRDWGGAARKRIGGFSFEKATEGLIAAMEYVSKREAAAPPPLRQ